MPVLPPIKDEELILNPPVQPNINVMRTPILSLAHDPNSITSLQVLRSINVIDQLVQASVRSMCNRFDVAQFPIRVSISSPHDQIQTRESIDDLLRAIGYYTSYRLAGPIRSFIDDHGLRPINLSVKHMSKDNRAFETLVSVSRID